MYEYVYLFLYSICWHFHYVWNKLVQDAHALHVYVSSEIHVYDIYVKIAGVLQNACIGKDADLLLMSSLQENVEKGPNLNLD